MRYAAAAVALLSATGAVAVPAQPARDTVDTTASKYAGFIFPNVIKKHDINSNKNTFSSQTVTVRRGGTETSTLYQLPVPRAAGGKTCTLVIRAGHVGHGDEVRGERALDIFNNNIKDLASLREGNFRNQELARVRFDAASGLYAFDAHAFPPRIRSFPCPAGHTLEWESVAVGDFDVNIIQQDRSFDGKHIPNGLTIGYF